MRLRMSTGFFSDSKFQASLNVFVLTSALACRRAVLHNLKFDERVASFENASGVGAKAALLMDKNKSKSGSGGACTAISFRTGMALHAHAYHQFPVVPHD